MYYSISKQSGKYAKLNVLLWDKWEWSVTIGKSVMSMGDMDEGCLWLLTFSWKPNLDLVWVKYDMPIATKDQVVETSPRKNCRNKFTYSSELWLMCICGEFHKLWAADRDVWLWPVTVEWTVAIVLCQPLLNQLFLVNNLNTYSLYSC